MSGRILWINPASQTPAYDYEALALLERRGHNLAYFGSRTAYNRGWVAALEQRFPGRLFSISGTVASRLRGVLADLALLVHLLRRSRREDQLVLSFPALFPLDALFLLWAGRRGVLLVHNVTPHDGTRWPARDRLLARCAGALWFASGYTAKQAQRQWGLAPAVPRIVLQHGLLPAAPEEPVPGSLVAERETLREAGRLRLALIGNVKPYKGVLPFLENMIAPAPEGFTVSVHGQWSEELRAERARLPEALPLHFHDRFLGDAALRQAFLTSPIVVMPYEAASQSGIFYNCLFYGCIPIVTDLGEAAARLRAAGLKRLCFSLASRDSFLAACTFVEEERASVLEKLWSLRRASAFAWNRL